MSYSATASRVRHASAAAIGEWNRADQASRSGGVQSGGSSANSGALASYHCGRSHPALSRKTAPSSSWRTWKGLTRMLRGEVRGCSGCNTS